MRLIELETTGIHDAIRYHITNNIPFRENIFRPGSQNFFKLFSEARKMYEKGLLNVDWEDQELFETEIGSVINTNKGMVALDLPFEDLQESEHSDRAGQIAADSVRGSKFSSKDDLESALSDALPNFSDKDYDRSKAIERAMEILYSEMDDMLEASQVKGSEPFPKKSKPTTGNSTPHPYRGRLVGEAEYQGKKVELNKPKRGGSKKYYVYTRNPKTGNIKKVSWGDTTGLKTKANNPGAVKSFVARHDCKNKKDKTKAGYWACRTPRYKSLGVKGGQWW
ncbi:MAG: hypothetical protein CBC05_00870 [Crocinitomicaceae bacterium TMED45]|nr:MAG: hypothetical protein CBC05_00870 [Crocinitomicaceae bacterium TMED45]|tara:strand:- start:4378 stop:5217 length:840 start_codon:yes stop_codon:yes gene_type:complete